MVAAVASTAVLRSGEGTGGEGAGALPFALATGSGALLLFAVQPMIAKFILPWFGGGAAVWSVCLLFFQLLLLAGYAYTHLVLTRLRPQAQVLLHGALLLLALAWLPVLPAEGWKPPDGELPLPRILLLLAATIGAPYLLLAATAPLMQYWLALLGPGSQPYRLYAASNAGAVLALLSYPLLAEPLMSRVAQAWTWSIGFVAFAALAIWCGFIVRSRASVARDIEPAAGSITVKAGPLTRSFWWLLPAAGTLLLLAVTNEISRDLAVVPFLLVVPLVLYLLTFILAFDHPRWYQRWLWLPLLAAISLFLAADALLPHVVVGEQALLSPLLWLQQVELSLVERGVLDLALLFVACMALHGELYRLRPPPAQLTAYYMALAAGGVLGSLFVTLAAPVLFDDYREYPLGIVLALVLLACAVGAGAGEAGGPGDREPSQTRRLRWLQGGFALLALGVGLMFYAASSQEDEAVSERVRGFYGVLAIEERSPENFVEHQRVMLHGGIVHGTQFQAPGGRAIPTSYYGYESGVGRVLDDMGDGRPRHVGVVGLGTGTLATYGQPSDRFRFYEIDPEVIRLASRWFTFIEDSPATSVIIPGDARISLEREADQNFDVLVLDAFTGGAIPSHLLTLEAFELYSRHLAEDGIIAVHVSNRYLQLAPIVVRAAEALGYHAIYVSQSDYGYQLRRVSGVSLNSWVLMSPSRTRLEREALLEAEAELPDTRGALRMWTDDWTSLLPILDL